MAETSESEPAPDPQRRPLPQGYRQGLITAITVLLGFSLAFFRFWNFEASGEWTMRSMVAAGSLILAIVLQLVALVRSLRLEDDARNEYQKTVRYFTASVVVLAVGLSIAVVAFSGGALTE